jgi:Zn-dependent peptidase ImmA (M78 family)
VTDNELYRSGLPDPIEREADGYAAELLMPSKLVRFAYKAGAIDVASLSSAFNVSYEAMKIRLRQLKLAP